MRTSRAVVGVHQSFSITAAVNNLATSGTGPCGGTWWIDEQASETSLPALALAKSTT